MSNGKDRDGDAEAIDRARRDVTVAPQELGHSDYRDELDVQPNPRVLALREALADWDRHRNPETMAEAGEALADAVRKYLGEEGDE